MFFWKKPKKVVVTFYTDRPGLPELFPVTRLNKVIPSWWKNMPSMEDAMQKEGKRAFHPKRMMKSIKHCYAVQKLWENGLAVPIWSDAFVTVSPDGKAHGGVPGNEPPGETHPVHQYPGMMTSNWVNWKMKSPWLVYSTEYAPFFVSNPFYHVQEHNWQTMPGQIEFFYQHHSNINMIFKKPNGSAHFEYDFRAGDIIAYMTPMFDREYEIRAETVSPEDYRKLEYGAKIWFSPASEQRKSGLGGCPLHKG